MTLTLDFDHVMIFAILLLSTLSLFLWSSIVQWRTWQYQIYVRYLQIGLLVCSAIYIAGTSFRQGEKKIHPLVISVCLYLIYMAVVSLNYYPGIMYDVIAVGFSWPLTMVAYFCYADRCDFSPVYRFTLALSFVAVSIPMAGILWGAHAVSANVGIINYVASYLPLVMLLCGKRTKYVITAAAVVLSVFSLKRGVMVALLAGFALMFLYSLYREKGLKGKIGKLLIIAGVVAILYFVANHLEVTQRLIRRFQKVSEDGGSGRDYIWNILLDAVKKSPWFYKTFGHGYHAFPRDYQPYDTYAFAHNSYLETLYDLGVIGLVWLVAMIVAIFVQVCRRIRERDRAVYPAMLAATIMIVLSMISYFFEEGYSALMIASFWGVFLGQRHREDQQPEIQSKPDRTYKYIR